MRTDSRRTGRAANAALPIITRNSPTEVATRVVKYNNVPIYYEVRFCIFED